MSKYVTTGISRSGTQTINEWIAHADKGMGTYYEVVFGSKHNYKSKDQVDCHIMHYENHEVVEKEGWETIVIIRDFFNLISSRLIRQERKKVDMTNLWLNHTAYYLKHPDRCILYDKWLTDDKYYKELQERYDLEPCERPTKFPKNGLGSGSSFGDKEIDKHKLIHRLDTFFERAHTGLKKEWWGYVNNDVIERNKEIFGFDFKEVMNKYPRA
jgi:hypothetical protein